MLYHHFREPQKCVNSIILFLLVVLIEPKKHSEYCTELLINRIKYLMGKYKRDMILESGVMKNTPAAATAMTVTSKRRHSLIINNDGLISPETVALATAANAAAADEDSGDRSSGATSYNVSSFDYATTTTATTATATTNSCGQNQQTSNSSGAPAVKIRTSTSFHYAERRSSAMIVNSRILTRRFVQLLTEIYEIAQVFPYVLST